MIDIGKGVVTTIEESGARVQSGVKVGDVTKPLVVPQHINKEQLQKGTKVMYVVFEDMTGVIIAII